MAKCVSHALAKPLVCSAVEPTFITNKTLGSIPNTREQKAHCSSYIIDTELASRACIEALQLTNKKKAIKNEREADMVVCAYNVVFRKLRATVNSGPG